TETDAGNPSIAITNRLIVAQGDRAIADARLAATAGDLETAAAQLANAEKFAHLDPASIDLVRQQVSQIDGDSQFLSGLATADAYITAGKLMPPGLDNAYAILTRLQQTHGDDARLIGPMERLGERLLTRAAFATAATKFDAATDFVDAVENLGILPLDVEFARVTLSASEEAFNAKAAEETAETLNVAAALVATNEVETAAATSGPTLLVAASETEAGVDGASATSQNATPTGPASPRAINIEDKGLTRYVAPVYPRRALQRGITGHVDIEFSITPDGKTDEISVVDAAPSKVFDSSAVKAVRKWRFEARDNPDRAKITLRFELPP
ncbi:MAG: energy transducer TonB, partial [Woeseia sp.]|nr:energy transducer TonB [Woeseia sp.]